MKNYVDELRERGPPEKRTISVDAFDPDVDTMGFCRLVAEVGGAVAPVPVRAYLRVIKNPSKKRGILRAADAAEHLLGTDLPCHGIQQEYGLVESQQVYPDPNAPRAKLVAQANDLLRLAHVAGCCQAVLLKRGAQVRVVLPAEWKGQRKKHADHAISIRRCAAASTNIILCQGTSGPLTSFVEGADLAGLVPQASCWEHALDALGMALYGMDEIAYGRWA